MNRVNLTKMSVVALTIILVLVPFQGLITAYLGSNLGHIDWVRIWKELLLVPVTIYAGWLLYKDRQLLQKLRQAKILSLCLIYGLLHILLGLWAWQHDQVSAEALAYALIINLRLVVIFLDVLIISSRSTFIVRNWAKILLVPAVVVIAFGLLQQFVLPDNFLSHLGYSRDTIPAYQTIDQKTEYIRAQSTLRGANPLGAYLLLIVTGLAVLLASTKDFMRRNLKLIMLLAAVVLLVFSFSRSAWLGTLLSAGILGYWLLGQRHRRWLVIGLAVMAVIGGGVVYSLRHNDTVQNTVFHTDEHSRSSVSTNQARSQALKEGFNSVVDQPLGRGPGTAGPASFRNDQPPRIAENYYIQLAQEVGVLGLVAFLGLNIIVLAALWLNRRDSLAQLLIASFIGITAINMLSHAWADDTLALIWWGLAGAAVASVILNKKRKLYAKSQNQKRIT